MSAGVEDAVTMTRVRAGAVVKDKFFVVILPLDPFPDLENPIVETAILWNPPGTGDLGLFITFSRNGDRPLDIDAELTLPLEDARRLSVDHGAILVFGDARITQSEALTTLRGHLEASEPSTEKSDVNSRGRLMAFAPGCPMCADGRPHMVLRLKPSRFMRVSKEEAMRSVQAALDKRAGSWVDH